MTSLPSPGAPPSVQSLRDAALDYLARYATTRASLRRFLHRRIARWETRALDDSPQDEAAIRFHAAAMRKETEAITAGLAASGAVDDAAFARLRGTRLAQAGRSRKAIVAYLVRKGAPMRLAQDAASLDGEGELAAALLTARRRRIGPFRTAVECVPDPALLHREKAALARAGFGREVTEIAMAMPLDDALALIARRRAA